ncbi:MAG: hypothetical protein AAFV07_16155, partial [Bacteroidota bacterium]
MKRIAFLILWLGIAPFLIGQTLDTLPFAGGGAPFIQYFSPLEYKASPTNYAVIQALDGVMYVANQEGVLEFDGAAWRLIPLPNKGKALSLAIDEHGTIFVGGESEFGFLEPDDLGYLQYVSLLPEITPSQTGFGKVNAVVATSEGVYFSTTPYIFRWADEQMEDWSWGNNDGFFLGFEVRDAFYCERMGRGLQMIKDDSLQLLGLKEVFEQGPLIGLSALDSAWSTPALMLMASGTLWSYEEGKSAQPFSIDESLQKFLQVNQADRMLALSDGRLAISTIKGGVILMNPDGKMDQLIDRQAGLPGASPTQLFEDQQGGLWITMDNGIARVEFNNPTTHFEEAQGLEGGARQIIRFADQLFVGNRMGLFRLFDQPDPFHLPFFEQVPNVPGGFSTMTPVGERLFIGTIESLNYVDIQGGVSNSTPFPIVQMHYAPREDEFLWLAFPDGMALMYEDPVQDSWYLIAHLPEYVKEASSIVEDTAGALWIGYGAEGIIRIDMSNLETQLDTSAFNEAIGLIDLTPELVPYGPEKGLPLGFKKVFKVHDHILAGTPAGLKCYDAEQDRFVSRPEWGPPSMDST